MGDILHFKTREYAWDECMQFVVNYHGKTRHIPRS